MNTSPSLRIFGHEATVEPLLRAVRQGRGAHAYLITGPPHVGKGTLARTLAGVYLCPRPNPPCDACSVCRRVAGGKHPDVDLLAPGGPCDESEHDHTRDNARDVRICQVRRAERLLNLAPFEGRTRVVIIDPADALNAQSADAFLKTLEEPPAASVIILTAIDVGVLPETVRSRCRLVTLRALPTAEIGRILEAERDAPPARAALLARLAAGRIGWALAAMDDPAFLEARAARLEGVAALATAGRAARFEHAEKLAGSFSRNREDVYAALSLWTSWWRDVLLIGAGTDDSIVNVDRRDELAAAAERHRPATVVAILRALRECRQDLEANISPRLALDWLMLRLPLPAPAGVSARTGGGFRRAEANEDR